MQALLFVAAMIIAAGGASKSALQPKKLPEVYLYGHQMRAPYSVDLLDATVRVNGVQVYPPLREPEQTLATPSDVPTDKYAFRQEGWRLQRQMEQEGKCCGEIASALADLYRSRSDLVADVRDVRSNSFWVRWNDGGDEEILIVPSASAQSVNERVQEEKQLIESLLAKGCIMVVSSYGRVFVPLDDMQRVALVQSEIARARRTPIKEFGTEAEHYLDGHWRGEYLPASVARQFARPLPLSEVRKEE